MNNRAALFAQAIRGPILLITVGVLFAIQQAGWLPFSRTWPLVIIVVGIVKLIERMNVQPQAPGAPGGTRPGGGMGPGAGSGGGFR
jgi:cell wall-active antibiotic response 4TMS protein YvqF